MGDCVECRECEGTGRLNGTSCDTCDNNGFVDDPSDGGYMNCPDCQGESGEPCSNDDCDGGWIYDD